MITKHPKLVEVIRFCLFAHTAIKMCTKNFICRKTFRWCTTLITKLTKMLETKKVWGRSALRERCVCGVRFLLWKVISLEFLIMRSEPFSLPHSVNRALYAKMKSCSFSSNEWLFKVINALRSWNEERKWKKRACFCLLFSTKFS
jgi:hypothetical protein